jgi:hypothetical protein
MMATLVAHAQSAPATPPNQADAAAKFAAHKQKELAHIAHHLQVIQTLQSCVESATDRAGLKACNETAHAAMKNHDK